MKRSFKEVFNAYELLKKAMPNKEDFQHNWAFYLEDSGWHQEDFQEMLDLRQRVAALENDVASLKLTRKASCFRY